jgi:hypothetical protein
MRIFQLSFIWSMAIAGCAITTASTDSAPRSSNPEPDLVDNSTIWKAKTDTKNSEPKRPSQPKTPQTEAPAQSRNETETVTRPIQYPPVKSVGGACGERTVCQGGPIFNKTK